MFDKDNPTPTITMWEQQVPAIWSRLCRRYSTNRQLWNILRDSHAVARNRRTNFLSSSSPAALKMASRGPLHWLASRVNQELAAFQLELLLIKYSTFCHNKNTVTRVCLVRGQPIDYSGRAPIQVFTLRRPSESKQPFVRVRRRGRCFAFQQSLIGCNAKHGGQFLQASQWIVYSYSRQPAPAKNTLTCRTQSCPS
jgi:hypothetical protein